MCWINIKNQQPGEGDIVDVWVIGFPEGDGRLCDLCRKGGRYYKTHPLTHEPVLEVPSEVAEGFSHWRPAPPPPSIHDR